MINSLRSHSLLGKFVLVGGLLSLVVFAKLPYGVEFLHVLQKTAHPVTFGLVSLLILSMLRETSVSSGSAARSYIFGFVATVGLGAAAEIAQFFVHRDPAVLDVFRDALGAGTALGGQAWIESRRCAGRCLIRKRIVPQILVVSGIAVIFGPLVWCTAAYANRDLHFPVVAQFESPLDLYFVGLNVHGLRRIPAPSAFASAADPTVLEVPLGSEPWPGVAIVEPYPDWTHKSVLAIDLTNPTEAAAAITVRINDRQHNQEFSDRFNREFIVPPQSRKVLRIPLTEIASAPRGRRMDMAHIAHIGLFSSRAPRPKEFLLNRVWVE